MHQNPEGAIGEGGARRGFVMQHDLGEPAVLHQRARRIVERHFQKAQRPVQRLFQRAGVQHRMAQQRE